MILTGTTIAPGIAHGPVLVWAPARVAVPRRKISRTAIPVEEQRLEHALRGARQELDQIAALVELSAGASAAEIFRAHELMLVDPSFVAAIRRRINEECWAAESAVSLTVDQLVQQFQQLDSSYLAARDADIAEVGRRLLTHLRKEDRDVVRLQAPAILVVENLAATDVVELDCTHLLALVMLQNGATSHAALLASTLGVPVVGGLPQLAQHIRNGDILVVDGNHGQVIVQPSELTLREYTIRREIFQRFCGELADLRDAPAVTQDGRRVRLQANIGLAQEVPQALAQGAEGIGLLRTEYFYLAHREPPDEEEQYRFYRDVIEAVGNRPVTFRTFDLGGDKLSMVTGPPEHNPMLGCRGIRLFTEYPELMAVQVRALLRASAHGPIRIMFPLLTGLAEFQDTMQIVDRCKGELRDRSKPFDPHVPFGCMIETPGAATTSDLLATEVEFFSIGSNDLIQYTLAADRTNPRLAHMYEPLHLGVLRLLRTIIHTGHRRQRPVSVCGEMASAPIYTIILLGMGLDELSVNPIMLPAVKQVIRGVTFADAREVARGVLRERRAKDVQAYLEKMMVRRFPELMSVYGNV